jgi:hypothetical protein
MINGSRANPGSLSPIWWPSKETSTPTDVPPNRSNPVEPLIGNVQHGKINHTDLANEQSSLPLHKLELQP